LFAYFSSWVQNRIDSYQNQPEKNFRKIKFIHPIHPLIGLRTFGTLNQSIQDIYTVSIINPQTFLQIKLRTLEFHCHIG